MLELANYRIRTKLGAAFAALTLATAAVGGFGLLQLQAVHTSTEDIAGNWLPSVKTLGDLRGLAAQTRQAESELALFAGTPRATALAQRIDTLEQQLGTAETTYRGLISSDEERSVYERFAQRHQAHEASDRKLRTLALQGGDAAQQARDYLVGESATAYSALQTELDALVALNARGADASRAAAEQSYARALNGVIFALLAAVALALALAVIITRAITRPVARAMAAAERVADGDLSSELRAEGRDEIAQLLRTLSGMQQRLAGIVRSVRGNAESVATASAQIAQGNADLSQRTEEQASALQQTAATMDELGGTVRNNADNAQQASQLARSASQVADQGGNLVREVVETMKGIDGSSRRIAEIIGLIDGIAFQTNILALNAAVEAARAGEQGRGFAVVAGEVRSLASRSAEAAREIKALIGASSERVAEGNALVERTGRTMDEIVGAIQRVNDIAAEISAASVEQSTGVSQVGEAVTQMDQVTQQNAALVEESAAAAESLRQQARLLVDAVAVFQLAEDGAARGASAAASAHSGPAASPTGVERRGPGRASNISRPRFGTPRTRPESPAPAAAGREAGTGTDGDWTSF